jgi:phosphoenolpyruvate carboxylase
LADDIGLNAPPIFEVVLPMVDSADKLMYIHDAFKKVAEVEHEMFTSHPSHTRYINVLPLVESSEDLLRSRKLLLNYLEMHKERYGKNPEYLRPFIARSDPAMNAGLIPAVLGAKAAISEQYTISREENIPVYPIIGVGSLPFRGGLSPYSINSFLKEYGGIRTVTVQSAFRYDYPLPDVKAAVKRLNQELEQTEPQIFSEDEINKLMEAAEIVQEGYKRTVESLALTINDFAQYVPERRERMLHTGLFGYSRAIGSKHLPRAIRFTAVLYSLGIPPELIGTGRGLRNARNAGLLKNIEQAYVNIEDDLLTAGRYLNKENLRLLAGKDDAWSDIAGDVELIEEYLGSKLEPKKDADFIHRNLTSNVLILYHSGQEFQPDLERAARLRRSLG